MSEFTVRCQALFLQLQLVLPKDTHPPAAVCGNQVEKHLQIISQTWPLTKEDRVVEKRLFSAIWGAYTITRGLLHHGGFPNPGLRL